MQPLSLYALLPGGLLNAFTDTEAPAAPTSVEETSVAATSIVMGWTASVAPGYPVDSYQVETKLRADPNTSFALHSSPTGVTATISSLTAGTIYSVRVRAVYNGGQFTAWAPSDDGYTISTEYTQSFTESAANQDVTFLAYETVLTAGVYGGGGAGGGVVNAGGVTNKNGGGGGGAGGYAGFVSVLFPASSPIRLIVGVTGASDTAAGGGGSTGGSTQLQYPIGTALLLAGGGGGGQGLSSSGAGVGLGGSGGSATGAVARSGGVGAAGDTASDDARGGGGGGGSGPAAAGTGASTYLGGTGYALGGNGGSGGRTASTGSSSSDISSTSPWAAPTGGSAYSAGGGGGSTRRSPSPAGAVGKPGAAGYATITYYYRG